MQAEVSCMRMNYTPFAFVFCAEHPQEQTTDLFTEEPAGEIVKHTHTHIMRFSFFQPSHCQLCINRVLLEVHDDGGFDVCWCTVCRVSVRSVSSPQAQQPQ